MKSLKKGTYVKPLCVGKNLSHCGSMANIATHIRIEIQQIRIEHIQEYSQLAMASQRFIFCQIF
jgi:hypothetical protein